MISDVPPGNREESKFSIHSKVVQIYRYLGFFHGFLWFLTTSHLDIILDDFDGRFWCTNVLFY